MLAMAARSDEKAGCKEPICSEAGKVDSNKSRLAITGADGS